MLDVGTGTYYLMTAHHIIDGCSAGDVSGQSVYQHGDYLGTVAESYDQHDVVLVTTDWFSARSGFADEIVEATQSLSGYVTPDGLSTMAMNGESCEKRGVATGADTPTVDEWGQTLNKCNNSYPDQVEYTNASNDGGDSGGPYFTASGDGYDILVGMHSARKDFFTTSGVAAYALDTEYGVIPT